VQCRIESACSVSLFDHARLSWRVISCNGNRRNTKGPLVLVLRALRLLLGRMGAGCKIRFQGSPPETMQFLFTVGAMPVCIACSSHGVLNWRRARKDLLCSIEWRTLIIGSLALFAVPHNGNTSLITSLTALYR